MLKEPITAITDFIIFCLDYAYAFILLTLFFSLGSLHHLFWGLFFLFGALGAFMGVVSHGFEMPEKRTAPPHGLCKPAKHFDGGGRSLGPAGMHLASLELPSGEVIRGQMGGMPI